MLENEPEQFIKSVAFVLGRKQGECSRCGEQAECMEIFIGIVYPDPATGKPVQADWNCLYCQSCVDEMMGKQKEGMEGYG